MSANEEKYHLINDYLSGELSGRALDKFKADLKEDESLQQAVAVQRSIIDALKTAREQELKAYIRTEVGKNKIFSLNPKMRIALVSAAAIALLAVAIFSLGPLLQNNTPSTAKKEVKGAAENPSENEVLSDIEDTATITSEITTVDTQTLAIAEPPKQEDLLLQNEDVEDYKTDIEELQEDYEEETATEDFDEDGIEVAKEKDKTGAVPTTTKKTATSSTTKDADMVVRSDELLGQKSFSVYAVALNTRATNLEEVSLEKKESRRDKKAREAAEESADNSKPTASASRAIKVEYWKSVVNYKGYQYDGSQVKLYGVDQQKNLKFNELDNRLYVKLEGKHYFLEKNTKYNRLVEVTNPTLLKVLNE